MQAHSMSFLSVGSGSFSSSLLTHGAQTIDLHISGSEKRRKQMSYGILASTIAVLA